MRLSLIIVMAFATAAIACAQTKGKRNLIRDMSNSVSGGRYEVLPGTFPSSCFTCVPDANGNCVEVEEPALREARHHPVMSKHHSMWGLRSMNLMVVNNQQQQTPLTMRSPAQEHGNMMALLIKCPLSPVKVTLLEWPAASCQHAGRCSR
jgi:hypothetical protein